MKKYLLILLFISLIILFLSKILLIKIPIGNTIKYSDQHGYFLACFTYRDYTEQCHGWQLNIIHIDKKYLREDQW